MTIRTTQNKIDCIIGDALAQIVAVRNGGEFPMGFDAYIEEIENSLLDALSDFDGEADKRAEEEGEEYERLTGHEMGVCKGRV